MRIKSYRGYVYGKKNHRWSSGDVFQLFQHDKYFVFPFLPKEKT